MGRETYELQRSDSVCPPPEVQIIAYVKNNLISNIKTLVTENPNILTTILGHPYNKPILYIACYEFAQKVTPETVKTLIDCGADLYYSDEIQDYRQAIHCAVLGGNSKILRMIISKLKPEKINSPCGGGNTALNLLIKEGNLSNPDSLECVRALLRAGADINKSDGKNLTPIFWAAKKGYKNIVEMILKESKQQVDIDSHIQRGKSARDYMIENAMIDLINATNNNAVTDDGEDNPTAILFQYLKEDNEDGFVNSKYLNDNFVDNDDGVSTLLQTATKKGFKLAVKGLLINGADPNKVTQKNQTYPIQIAANHGYHEIFEILADHEKTIIPPEILIELLRHVDNEVTHGDVNHSLCYDILMTHKNKIPNINVSDVNDRTALHFAARYGGAEKTLDLLRLGASMACRDRYDALPVEDIDANTLEAHLNECLETNLEYNIDKENATATYNYQTLMPPRKARTEDFIKGSYDAEVANKLILDEIQQIGSETQVITYMSKSPELKHLLKHPVITSFLYMKWHRIRWFFYTNLVFYITFCLSLILYVLLIYSNQGSDEKSSLAYFLSIMVSITFTLLFLREIFQIAVSPKSYFLNFENWLELLLITLTAIILFQKSPTEDFRRQVSAITILLTAFEMVLLIGQHPKMSINIVMLRTVSVNFFKFLLWYSILILAFSLSFFTLFKDYPNMDKGNATTKDDESGDGKEESQDFFLNPGISLFKTIVMLTGEFDASDMNFQVYPITSHIIFMLFVFMIAIILFNLLNGLAVSDTQLIKNNAELVGYIARIEHIAYIESMLLGNILPTNVLNILQKYCCCLPETLGRFRTPGILARRVCLFPYFLRDYKMTVYPNKHAKVALCSYYSDDDSDTCMGNCKRIYLDKQSAKRTKQLIKAKKEALDKERCEQSVLSKQKEVIERQQNYINELKREQNIILNKLDYIITNISVKA